jgi:2-keto-4-pentenoate hydratase/2-oxohepta-3-ene-1,7-dioic acid hydratase in catechol pathway
MATMAAAQSPLKQAGKVVCIGRNYAYVLPRITAHLRSSHHSIERSD